MQHAIQQTASGFLADSKNMDIVGANTTLDWDTSAKDILAMNEGLTTGRVERLMPRIEKLVKKLGLDKK